VLPALLCVLHHAACDSFAQTWASCPTRTRVCCSNPGDVCVRQTDTWSRCEPSSSTAARESRVLRGDAGHTHARHDTTHVHRVTRLIHAGAPPRGMPPPPLATDGGNRIVRVDNWAPVTVKGLNWFGFNVARSMVGGLGQGGSSAATDFGTIVYQLKCVCALCWWRRCVCAGSAVWPACCSTCVLRVLHALAGCWGSTPSGCHSDTATWTSPTPSPT
jgi:hypothetical protein